MFSAGKLEKPQQTNICFTATFCSLYQQFSKELPNSSIPVLSRVPLPDSAGQLVSTEVLSARLMVFILVLATPV